MINDPDINCNATVATDLGVLYGRALIFFFAFFAPHPFSDCVWWLMKKEKKSILNCCCWYTFVKIFHSLFYVRTNKKYFNSKCCSCSPHSTIFFMKNNFHSAISKCDKLLAVSNWIALAQRLLRGMKILYSHF